MSEFARAIGKTVAYVYALESGKLTNISNTVVELLCLKFNISKRWLFEDKGPMKIDKTHIQDIELKPVMIVGNVPAGYPQEPVETIKYAVFPDVPYGAKAVIVKGDSMSPGIKNGDYAIWIDSVDIKHNDIVIVADEWGDIMLKRFKKKDDRVLLVSDNPDYPSYRPNEHYRIIGKVVKIISVKDPSHF